MNGSKKARYVNSIVNRNQGGGDKKAGIVPTMRMTQAKYIAFKNRGQPKSAAVMKITANPKVQQSRPISTLPMNWH